VKTNSGVGTEVTTVRSLVGLATGLRVGLAAGLRVELTKSACGLGDWSTRGLGCWVAGELGHWFARGLGYWFACGLGRWFACGVLWSVGRCRRKRLERREHDIVGSFWLGLASKRRRVQFEARSGWVFGEGANALPNKALKSRNLRIRCGKVHDPAPLPIASNAY
jgi:hypothetical protein